MVLGGTTRALLGVVLPALAAAGGGCGDPAPAPGTRIGLLLSYTGDLAANSVNSERAVLLAVEAANAAGGVGGRPVAVEARDTRSAPSKVSASARQLLDRGVALVIGPDTTELGVEVKGLLADRTVIMPSFATSDSTIYKPHSWFVMGAPASRVACELFAQVTADGRRKPLVISDANGYSSLLGFELVTDYELQRVNLPTQNSSTEDTVRPIMAAGADAYLLAALPRAATTLLYALVATGSLRDPTAWYLSPTLHTPALLATLPRGMLAGARGVASGTVAGAHAFRERFEARWQDQALDDAYPFYDAAAVALLALERALVKEGAVPAGTGLGKHIVAVTHTAGVPVEWNQIGDGLRRLRDGEEVAYVGLSGTLEFDVTGQSRAANTSWWQVGPAGFVEVPSQSNCRRGP